MPSLPTPGALDLWGAQLNAWLLVAHNADGTLRPQAAATLSAILAASNDAGGLKIANLATPTNSADATTKAYVDAAIVAGVTPTLAAVLLTGNDAGAGTITNLGVPAAQSNAAPKGYVDSITFNTQAGSTYTLVASDVGKCVNLTNAGAVAVTVPPASSVGGWPTTFGQPTIQLRQFGGTVTVSPGAGVGIHSRGGAVTLAGQYAWATLVNTSGDNWDMFGDIA